MVSFGDTNHVGGRRELVPPGDWSSAASRRTLRVMKKRVLVAILWFYAAWYGGALLAEFLALDPVIGPIIGAVAGVVVGTDPFGLFWERRPKATRTYETAPSPR